MRKIKEILLGTSFMWLPVAGSFIAELILKIIL